ncbi:hypothetical protein PG2T_09835 [Immundisolibacter cernigliae]|uniref:Uncharacterized protein n=2 Tax=Immundisolibacter cernigliae TaxID=1810504 RepID=A0A1B1YUQ2_9GAMM|nr:hypothetical protein PG2T_09835 [Immundisolibacter cernigliae]
MMKMKGKLSVTAAALLVGVGLSGCGKDRSTEPAPQANPFAGLPFVLVPGPDGNLEPRTPDGKPIPPSDKPPEEGIKAIRSLSQVAVLKIDGSCYYWIYFQSRWYKAPC